MLNQKLNVELTNLFEVMAATTEVDGCSWKQLMKICTQE